MLETSCVALLVWWKRLQQYVHAQLAGAASLAPASLNAFASLRLASCWARLRRETDSHVLGPPPEGHVDIGGRTCSATSRAAAGKKCQCTPRAELGDDVYSRSSHDGSLEASELAGCRDEIAVEQDTQLRKERHLVTASKR